MEDLLGFDSGSSEVPEKQTRRGSADDLLGFDAAPTSSKSGEKKPGLLDRFANHAVESTKVGANIATSLGSGIFGAGAALRHPSEAVKNFNEASEAFADKTHIDYKDPKGPYASAEKHGMEGLEWLFRKAGDASVAAMGRGSPSVAVRGMNTLVDLLNPEGADQREALYRGVGEVGSQFIPIERGAAALRGRRPEPPAPEPRPEPPHVDTTQYRDGGDLFDSNPQDLVAPEIRDQFQSPYNLDEQTIARIEQELNPATEQRIQGQGELFTGERPYEDGELIGGNPVELIEGGRGRDSIVPLDSAVAHSMESEKGLGGATEQSNFPADIYSRDLPSTPDKGLPFVPRGQRGSVTPSVFIDGLKRMLGVDVKSLSHAERVLTEKLESAMDHRDVVMKQWIQEKMGELENIRKPLGQTRFGGSQRGGRQLFNESAIVDKAKAGDHQAFRTLFEEYAPRLERMWTRKLDGDHAMAKDIVQEAFMKAFKNFDQFEGKSKFYTWVYQIADRVRKDQIDKLIRRIQTVELSPEMKESFVGHHDTPEQSMIARQQTERIQRAIDDLPSSFREAFNLREMEGYTYAEIAAKQDVPIGTVKSRINKARETLEKNLKAGQTKIGKSQRGSANFGLGEWLDKKLSDRSKSKEGFMGGIKEAVRQFKLSESRIPLTEMLKERGLNLENITDVSESFVVGAKALTDKTFSILSQTTKGAGDIIKWVVDNEKMIDQERDLNIQAAIKGEEFVKGKGVFSRGFEHHEWSEAGATKLWKQMYAKNPTELAELKTEWIAAMMEGRDPVFKTQAQERIFQAVQKQLQIALDKVNDVREKAGLNKIKPIKNYFPALWMGDYRFVVKNKAGEKVGYYAFDTVFEAKKTFKEMQKQFPDLDFSDIYHAKKGKYDLDTSAFEESMRILGKDDPATKALQKAYADVRQHRGFGGKRGLTKQNILGFMGSEAGKIGVKNAEKAIETYLTKMYTYAANVEKGLIAKQLAELPREIQQKIPNTMKLTGDFLDHARGGELAQKLAFVDDMAKFVARGTGVGESSIGKTLAGTKAVMGLYWLFTPKFIYSQIPQHTLAISKMTQLVGVPKAALSWFEGLKNTIAPDKTAMEAVNWSRRKGYLDSVIVDLLDTTELGAQNAISDRVKHITASTLGKVEQQLVRIPAFLMFESALRNVIKEPHERFEVASELMDHYMVNYREAAKPMVYNHMGEVMGGQAASLKQFSHNSFGQFFEHVQTAKDGRGLAPLATFMGTQALVGGLKGAVLVAEATAIITAINALSEKFGWDVYIPTPEQYMLASGFSDEAIYGLASTVIGQDVSASVGAPGLPDMLSLAPQQFAATMVRDVGTYVMKYAAGTATEADEMKALFATTPNAAKAWIEEMYTDEGKPVPSPYANMRGNWVRNEDEWAKDKWFGGRSVGEAKANALARAAKTQILDNLTKRNVVLGAITDRMVAGKQVDPELLRRYIQAGGSLSGLKAAVKREIIRRNFTYMESQVVGKQPSPGLARNLDITKEYREGAQRGQ